MGWPGQVTGDANFPSMPRPAGTSKTMDFAARFDFAATTAGDYECRSLGLGWLC